MRRLVVCNTTITSVHHLPINKEGRHTSLLSVSGIASSSLTDVLLVALVTELPTVFERCGRFVVAGLVGVDMVLVVVVAERVGLYAEPEDGFRKGMEIA